MATHQDFQLGSRRVRAVTPQPEDTPQALRDALGLASPPAGVLVVVGGDEQPAPALQARF